jgi:hypothetical protein
VTDGWPFDQPPNAAAITVEAVLSGAPILVVTHDGEDDGWQFLDGEPPDEASARVVAMQTAFDLDPSLREIADLPPGWTAWRTGRSGVWQRSPDSPPVR